jgi:hypothetical protein
MIEHAQSAQRIINPDAGGEPLFLVVCLKGKPNHGCLIDINSFFKKKTRYSFIKLGQEVTAQRDQS